MLIKFASKILSLFFFLSIAVSLCYGQPVVPQDEDCIQPDVSGYLVADGITYDHVYVVKRSDDFDPAGTTSSNIDDCSRKSTFRWAIMKANLTPNQKTRIIFDFTYIPDNTVILENGLITNAANIYLDGSTLVGYNSTASPIAKINFNYKSYISNDANTLKIKGIGFINGGDSNYGINAFFSLNSFKTITIEHSYFYFTTVTGTVVTENYVLYGGEGGIQFKNVAFGNDFTQSLSTPVKINDIQYPGSNGSYYPSTPPMTFDACHFFYSISTSYTGYYYDQQERTWYTKVNYRRKITKSDFIGSNIFNSVIKTEIIGVDPQGHIYGKASGDAGTVDIYETNSTGSNVLTYIGTAVIDPTVSYYTSVDDDINYQRVNSITWSKWTYLPNGTTNLNLISGHKYIAVASTSETTGEFSSAYLHPTSPATCSTTPTSQELSGGVYDNVYVVTRNDNFDPAIWSASNPDDCFFYGTLGWAILKSNQPANNGKKNKIVFRVSGNFSGNFQLNPHVSLTIDATSTSSNSRISFENFYNNSTNFNIPAATLGAYSNRTFSFKGIDFYNTSSDFISSGTAANINFERCNFANDPSINTGGNYNYDPRYGYYNDFNGVFGSSTGSNIHFDFCTFSEVSNIVLNEPDDKITFTNCNVSAQYGYGTSLIGRDNTDSYKGNILVSRTTFQVYNPIYYPGFRAAINGVNSDGNLFGSANNPNTVKVEIFESNGYYLDKYIGNANIQTTANGVKWVYNGTGASALVKGKLYMAVPSTALTTGQVSTAFVFTDFCATYSLPLDADYNDGTSQFDNVFIVTKTDDYNPSAINLSSCSAIGTLRWAFLSAGQYPDLRNRIIFRIPGNVNPSVINISYPDDMITNNQYLVIDGSTQNGYNASGDPAVWINFNYNRPFNIQNSGYPSLRKLKGLGVLNYQYSIYMDGEGNEYEHVFFANQNVTGYDSDIYYNAIQTFEDKYTNCAFGNSHTESVTNLVPFYQLGAYSAKAVFDNCKFFNFQSAVFVNHNEYGDYNNVITKSVFKRNQLNIQNPGFKTIIMGQKSLGRIWGGTNNSAAEKVEIYLTNAGGIDALEYIGSAIVTDSAFTDNGENYFKWTYVPGGLNRAILDGEKVIAVSSTTTSSSEFSKSFYFKDRIECNVTTVTDNVPGSFRYALNCANNAGKKAVIQFNIPGDSSHNIYFDQNIPPLYTPYFLTNPFGVEIQGKNLALTDTATWRTNIISINFAPNTIARLQFKNSNNIKIENIRITDRTDDAARLEFNYCNDVIVNKTYFDVNTKYSSSSIGDEIGIMVGGCNNVTIKDCDFKNLGAILAFYPLDNMPDIASNNIQFLRNKINGFISLVIFHHKSINGFYFDNNECLNGIQFGGMNYYKSDYPYDTINSKIFVRNNIIGSVNKRINDGLFFKNVTDSLVFLNNQIFSAGIYDQSIIDSRNCRTVIVKDNKIDNTGNVDAVRVLNADTILSSRNNIATTKNGIKADVKNRFESFSDSILINNNNTSFVAMNVLSNDKTTIKINNNIINKNGSGFTPYDVGILLDGGNNISVRNCSLGLFASGTFSCGILASGSPLMDSLYISNNQIINTRSYGIQILRSTKSGNLTNNFLGVSSSLSTGYKSDYGLHMAGSMMNKSFLVDNNTIGNTALAGVFTASIRNVSFTDNYIGISKTGNSIPNTGIGLQFNGSRACLINKNQVANSTIGLHFQDGDTMNVKSNYVYQNSLEGIKVENSSSACHLTSNKVYNNKTGIFFGNGSNYSFIDSNIVNNNDEDGIALKFGGSNSTVIQNTVNNNGQTGILLADGASYNHVFNNIAYNNTKGLAILSCPFSVLYGNKLRNNTTGLEVSNAYLTEIYQNQIYDNTGNGIYTTNSSNNGSYYNNFIGLDSLETAHPNGGYGLIFDNGANTNSVYNNEIANSALGNVNVTGSSTFRNKLSKNKIFNNPTGINLRSNPNSIGNTGILAPVITSKQVVLDTIIVSGSSSQGTLEFFKNNAQKDQALKFVFKNTQAFGGYWTAKFHKSELPVIATVTDPNGNTSEFSEIIQDSEPICSNFVTDVAQYKLADGITYDTVFVVTRTDDFDPNLITPQKPLDDCDFAGTLRWAILKCAQQGKKERVVFKIPGTGKQTINLTSRLNIKDSLIVIDGYTQSGNKANRDISIAGTLEIYESNKNVIKGLEIQSAFYVTKSFNCTLSNVSFVNCQVSLFEGHKSVLDSNQFAGNTSMITVSHSNKCALTNNAINGSSDNGAVYVNDSDSLIFSNNTLLNIKEWGIRLQTYCDYATISNNVISQDTSVINNYGNGILISGNCDNNLVLNNKLSGFTTSGIRFLNYGNNNTVKLNEVGKSNIGIKIDDPYNGTNNVIAENFIGVSSASDSLGIKTYGIEVFPGSKVIIKKNTIGFCKEAGILVVGDFYSSTPIKIDSNLVGISKLLTAIPNKYGFAMRATGVSIGRNNIIANNKNAGIINEGGVGYTVNKNTFTQNLLYKNQVGILLSKGPSNFAKSNDDILAPVVTGHQNTIYTDSLLIQGTVNRDGVFELFSGDGLADNALSYIKSITISTGNTLNGDRNWTTLVNKNLFLSGKLNLLGTLTDKNGNTSPFSSVYKIELAKTCLVTKTTDDNTEGTLRWALGCVSRAGTVDTVKFAITPIVLTGSGAKKTINLLDTIAVSDPDGFIVDGYSQSKNGLKNIEITSNRKKIHFKNTSKSEINGLSLVDTRLQFSGVSKYNKLVNSSLTRTATTIPFDTLLYFAVGANGNIITRDTLSQRNYFVIQGDSNNISNCYLNNNMNVYLAGKYNKAEQNFCNSTTSMGCGGILSKFNIIRKNTFTASGASVFSQGSFNTIDSNTFNGGGVLTKVLMQGCADNLVSANNISSTASVYGINVTVASSTNYTALRNTFSKNTIVNTFQPIRLNTLVNANDGVLPPVFSSIEASASDTSAIEIIVNTKRKGIVEFFRGDSLAKNMYEYHKSAIVSSPAVNNEYSTKASFPKSWLNLPTGYFLVATLTDTAGNTSELSKAFKIKVSNGICVVTDTTDQNTPGSLRAAIGCANVAGNGKPVISFAIPGSFVKEIKLKSALPKVENIFGDSIIIDASTQYLFNSQTVKLIGVTDFIADGITLNAFYKTRIKNLSAENLRSFYVYNGAVFQGVTFKNFPVLLKGKETYTITNSTFNQTSDYVSITSNDTLKSILIEGSTFNSKNDQCLYLVSKNTIINNSGFYRKDFKQLVTSHSDHISINGTTFKGYVTFPSSQTITFKNNNLGCLDSTFISDRSTFNTSSRLEVKNNEFGGYSGTDALLFFGAYGGQNDTLLLSDNSFGYSAATRKKCPVNGNVIFTYDFDQASILNNKFLNISGNPFQGYNYGNALFKENIFGSKDSVIGADGVLLSNFVQANFIQNQFNFVGGSALNLTSGKTNLQNNIFNQIGKSGAHLESVKGDIISNNKFSGIGEYGIYGNGYNTSLSIKKNKFEKCQLVGIYINDSYGQNEIADSNIFTNNALAVNLRGSQVIIVNNYFNSDSTQNNGINIESANNCKIESNTASAKDFTAGSFIQFASGRQEKLLILNNSIYGYINANIKVEGSENKKISRNLLDNASKGISINYNSSNLNLRGNANKLAPRILAATPTKAGDYNISGKATPGDSVELFLTNSLTREKTTKWLLTKFVSNSDSTWNAVFSQTELSADSIQAIRATATSGFNTSELSNVVVLPRITNGICIVTDTTDNDVPGSLRAAIRCANSGNNGKPVISFAIPGSYVKEIKLKTALPKLENIFGDSVVVDGSTQRVFSGIISDTILIDAQKAVTTQLYTQNLNSFSKVRFERFCLRNFNELYFYKGMNLSNMRIDSSKISYSGRDIFSITNSTLIETSIDPNNNSFFKPVKFVIVNSSLSASNEQILNSSVDSLDIINSKLVLSTGSQVLFSNSGYSKIVKSSFSGSVYFNGDKVIFDRNKLGVSGIINNGQSSFNTKHLRILNGEIAGPYGLYINVSDSVIIKGNQFGYTAQTNMSFPFNKGFGPLNLFNSNLLSTVIDSNVFFNVYNNSAINWDISNSLSKVKISRNIFGAIDKPIETYAINCNGKGELLINDNQFLNCATTGNVVLLLNNIGTQKFNIRNNKFLKSAGTSLYCTGPNFFIKGNLFEKNLRGLFLNGSDGAVVDSNNVFTKNTKAIEVNAAQVYIAKNSFQTDSLSNNGIYIRSREGSVTTGEIFGNKSYALNTTPESFISCESSSQNSLLIRSNNISGYKNSIINVVEGSSNKKISRNLLNHPTKAININYNNANAALRGNTNKKAPKLSGIFSTTAGFSVSGKSAPGDSVEIFIANTLKGSVTSKFIRTVFVSAPDSSFTAIIPFDSTSSYDTVVVRSTATKVYNTSQLSDSVTYCISCPCVVTALGDQATLGTLRYAIGCANGKPVDNTIQFAIPGAGPYTIELQSSLPDLANYNKKRVTLDGNTQIINNTNSGANPTITIKGGTFATGYDYGLSVVENSAVKNLVFADFFKGTYPVALRLISGALAENITIFSSATGISIENLAGKNQLNTISNCKFNGLTTGINSRLYPNKLPVYEGRFNCINSTFWSVNDGFKNNPGVGSSVAKFKDCYFGMNATKDINSSTDVYNTAISSTALAGATDSLFVTGCYFVGCSNGAIYTSNKNVSVSNNYFGVSPKGIFKENNYALFTSGPKTRNEIIGNRIAKSKAYSFAIKVANENTTSTLIQANKFGYGLTDNVKLSLPNVDAIRIVGTGKHTIDGNYIFKTGRGIVDSLSTNSVYSYNQMDSLGSTSMDFYNVTGATISGNTIKHGNSYGFYSAGSNGLKLSSNTFKDNTVSNFTAVKIVGGSKQLIEGNTFDNNTNGVQLKSNRINLSGNTFNKGDTAVSLIDNNNSKLANNTISTFTSRGIMLKRSSFDTLQFNTINDTLVQTGAGIGLEITQSSSNNIVTGGEISNQRGAGVKIVFKSVNNIISHVRINQNTTAIGLDRGGATTYSGNNSRITPVINKMEWLNGEIKLNITSLANDKIEVFVSKRNGQRLLSWVKDDILTANTGDIIIQNAIANPDFKDSIIVRVTARNGDGTSEPSAVAWICPKCICLVKTATDVANAPATPMTFRQAVTKANLGQCGVINFSISPGNNADTISLTSNFPALTASMIINGASESGFKPSGSPVVWIKKDIYNDTCLRLSKDSIRIKGIGIKGGLVGIKINANKCTVDSSVIYGTGNEYMVINGHYNSISNSYFGKGKSGFVAGNKNGTIPGISVYRDNNLFDNCDVANSMGYNIFFRGTSKSNFFSKGSLTKSGVGASANKRAIQFENTSVQHNKLAPFINSHSIKSNGSIELSGTCESVTDVIQLYSSTSVTQTAVAFLPSNVVVSGKNWTATINGTFTEGQQYYFVATATNTLKSTSPLSRIYRTVPEYDVCYVTNTNNVGTGSLRDALDCVNNADNKAQVVFSIATGSTITLTSAPNLVVNNSYGVLIDATGKNITVNTDPNTNIKFLIKSPNVRFEGFTLEKINLTDSGENNIIKKMLFKKDTVFVKTKTGTTNIESNSFQMESRLVISEATRARISKNLFEFPTGNRKAITHRLNGNNSFTAPTISIDDALEGNLYFKLKSKQQGDTIELFKGSVTGQTASVLLGTYVAGVNGYVTATLPNPVFTGDTPQDLFYTATARDVNWNTSELSTTFKLGACIVRTTNNAYFGSLRVAIEDANANKCSVILFDISGSDKAIKLDGNLPIVVKSNLIIDGTSQAGYLPNKVPLVSLVIAPWKTATYGISSSAINNKIHGLQFDSLATGIQLNSAHNVLLRRNNFNKCSSGITLSGTLNKASILNSNFGSTPQKANLIGINSINTKSLTIDTCKFYTINNGKGILSSGDSSIITRTSFSSGSVSATMLVPTDTAITIKDSKGSFITDNYFTAVGTGIGLNRYEGRVMSNNFAKRNDLPLLVLKSAVTINSAKNTTISSNYIRDFRENAMKIENLSVSNFVERNTFDSVKTAAIRFENCNNTEINSNRVSFSSADGLSFNGTSTKNIIDNNFITRCFENGIRLDGSENSLAVNYIGDGGKRSKLGNGVGIYIKGDKNTIGKDTLGNFIMNNKFGGIVNEGQKNKIVYNVFVHNDTNYTQVKWKAIINKQVGSVKANEGIEPPQNLSYKHIANFYNITGSSAPNDSIHLYLSYGYQQDALKLLGTAKSNSAGEWLIPLNESFLDKNRTTYVLATATKLQVAPALYASTSELSKMMPVGKCYITDTKDVPDNRYPLEGTVRAAVACANDVPERAQVVTKIPFAPNAVLMDSLLPPIKNKYGLDWSGANLDTISENFVIRLNISSTNSAVEPFALSIDIPDSVTATVKYTKFNGFIDAIKVNSKTMEFENITSECTELKPGNSLVKSSVIATTHRFKKVTGKYLKFVYATVPPINALQNIEITNSSFEWTKSVFTPSALLRNVKILNNKWLYSENWMKTGIIDTVQIVDNQFVVNDSCKTTGVKRIVKAEIAQSLSLNSNSFSSIGCRLAADSVNALFEILDARSMEFKNNKITMDTSGYSALATQDTNRYINAANIFRSTSSDSLLTVSNNEIDIPGIAFSLVGPKFNLDNNKLKTGRGGIAGYRMKRSVINNNNITTSNKAAVMMRSCDTVSMHRNLMIGNKGLTKIVNINRLNSDSSNHNIITPFIEACIPQGNKSGEPTFMIMYGTASPKSKIQIYLSEKAQPNTTYYFTDSISTDSLGVWKYKIPRNWHRRSMKDTMYITSQATSPAGNSSEISNVFALAPYRATYIVKNTKNDGANSLREAVGYVNATEFYTKVIFNIQDAMGVAKSGPHVILLDSILDTLQNYTGFHFDGYSQKRYARQNGILDLDQETITVSPKTEYLASDTNNRFAIIVDRFTGDSTKISQIGFDGFKRGIHLKTGQVDLDSVSITYGNRSTTGLLDNLAIQAIQLDTLTPIYDLDAREKGLENYYPQLDEVGRIRGSRFEGFNDGIRMFKKLNEIEIRQNYFNRINNGIVVSPKTTKSNIVGNTFFNIYQTAIRIDSSGTDNLVNGNSFGYDTATSSYAMEMPNPVWVRKSSENYILGNNIYKLHSSDSLLNVNGILITDSSERNYVRYNTIGWQESKKEDFKLENNPYKIHKKSIGIYLINEGKGIVADNHILENTISYVNTGIKFKNVEFNKITGNSIGAFIKVDKDSVDTTYILIRENGVLIEDSKNNDIISNNIGNFGKVATGYGIELRNSRDILISKNMIRSNYSNKGIYYIDGSNGGLKTTVPKFDPTYVYNNLQITLAGTVPGKTNGIVEVFTANRLKEQSQKYIGQVILDNGTWKMLVPKDIIDFGDTNFFVATFRENNNTSPFSASYPISDLLCKLKPEDFQVKTPYLVCPGVKTTLLTDLKGLDILLYKLNKQGNRTDSIVFAKDDKEKYDKEILKANIVDSGKYELVAKSIRNVTCVFKTDIHYKYKSAPTTPSFLVNKTVYVNDTVTLVDLNYAIANRTKVEWKMGDFSSLIDKSNIPKYDSLYKNNNGKYSFITFSNVGVDTIRQISTTQEGCAITLSKPVTVLAQPTDKKIKNLIATQKGSIFEESIYPVPVGKSQDITISFETDYKEPFSIYFARGIDGVILQRHDYTVDDFRVLNNGMFEFEQVFKDSHNLASGFYIVRIETQSDLKILKMIVD